MPNHLIADKPRKLASLLDNLRKSGLRITQPRIGVLEALLSGHGPFTTEEIYSFVHEKTGCDLATIYRSLSSLENVHLIQRCEFGDGTARYELSSMEDHHHHHLICRKCKAVEVLDDCELQEIDRIAQRRGFSDVTHSLEFFGICPSCKSA